MLRSHRSLTARLGEFAGHRVGHYLKSVCIVDTVLLWVLRWRRYSDGLIICIRARRSRRANRARAVIEIAPITVIVSHRNAESNLSVHIPQMHIKHISVDNPESTITSKI